LASSRRAWRLLHLSCGAGCLAAGLAAAALGCEKRMARVWMPPALAACVAALGLALAALELRRRAAARSERRRGARQILEPTAAAARTAEIDEGAGDQDGAAKGGRTAEVELRA